MPCTIIGAFTHSPRLHCMHYVPCSRGLTVCIGALTHMLTQTYAHRACKHQAPHIVFYIPCMCPCAMQPSPSDPIHCIYYISCNRIHMHAAKNGALNPIACLTSLTSHGAEASPFASAPSTHAHANTCSPYAQAPCILYRFPSMCPSLPAMFS